MKTIKQTLIEETFKGKPHYTILEPILQCLLSNGNELATSYRWGSNPTGYFCLLKQPIDLDLIERSFVLPPSIQLMKEFGEVDYGLGTAIIRKQ
jgi:hypothetical protein